MFLYWGPRLLYRFLTGLHMDGRVRRHPQTGKVKPLFKDYWWNRYSRPKRAAIRLMVTTIILGLPLGYIVDWWLTRFVLLAATPFVALWLARKLLNELTSKHKFHVGEGYTQEYRTLRPKYSRKLRKIQGWRFRLHPPESEVVSTTSTEGRAILADNAEDGGPPVTSLRRPLGLAELQSTEGAPKDGRSRTMRRSVERRRKA